MKIIQRVYAGAGITLPQGATSMPLGENLLKDEGNAYRVAFQALPGTQFRISGQSEENVMGNNLIDTRLDSNEVLVMGHTGIYELGFSQALISNFTVEKIVDDKSIMLFDALVQGESADYGQDRAITAQEFEYYENSYAAENTSLFTNTQARWEGEENNG